jgi:hypothetical protein
MRVHHHRRFGRLLLMPAPHLTATEIASFIDGTLFGGDRHRAEQHLAACARCREELAACARIANEAPASRPSRALSWRWVGLATAAGLVGVVLTAPRWRAPRNISEERAPASASAIAVVAPPRGTLRRSDLRFVWRSTGSVSYRVSVTDASGGLVWRQDVRDTSFVPPADTLKPGVSYFWRVEALLSDGRVVESTLHSFTVTE